MTIQIGDHIPEVTLQRIREGVETLDTNALFDGRNIVLFAVPGAFTPTCSEKHLPGFVQHFEDFRSQGVEVGVILHQRGETAGCRHAPAVAPGIEEAAFIGVALVVHAALAV